MEEEQEISKVFTVDSSGNTVLLKPGLLIYDRNHSDYTSITKIITCGEDIRIYGCWCETQEEAIMRHNDPSKILESFGTLSRMDIVVIKNLNPKRGILDVLGEI